MKIISLMGLCGAMMISGCSSNAPEPLANTKIGQNCVVQFRRDALGSASPVPIGPDTDNFNNAEITIAGTLKKVQADAILIATSKADYLIPMRVVLCMKFESTTPAKQPTAAQSLGNRDNRIANAQSSW
jgi:hypothetical protein